MSNQQGRANRTEPTIWNPLMDCALVKAFVYQMEIGNKVNGQFTSKILENIVNEVSNQFPGVRFDKEKVKNRMKYIKKGFGPCFDIFKNGLSGFSWDPINNTWCAEPEVWDKLIEAHPQAASWRNKSIPNYDDLKLLYGGDRATLDESETAREMRERIRKEQEETHASTIEEIDNMVFNDEVRLENPGYDTPTSAETPLQNHAEGRRAPKRKLSLVDEVTSVKKTFETVADAIAKAAAEMVKTQPVGDMVKSVSKSETWNLLEELGLNALEMHKAYIFLIKNPDMLDGILSCPSSERRVLLFEMMK